jgi:CubicO group peptidase (beta-lactamase class C family)
MKRQLFILLALLPLLLTAQVGDLPRSTPATEGISTQAVINMMDSLMALPECDIHHVMVVRHGKVVAELHPAPFRATDSHTLYSASKTFVSLAVGCAIDDNLLRLDDRVMTFFPDKRTNRVSDNMAAMTVRDLLMMASGVKPDWTMRNNSLDWVKDWLAKPVDNAPGSLFQYDSMCTFMLSAILQRVTGQTMLEYLQKKLFEPMHITIADWESSPDGINTGGWGLRVQAETMAKLGLLLLNKGRWEGQQLINADYVEAACSRLIDGGAKETTPPTDGNQGYGYQVWQSKWPGSYRADGAMGQYTVVVPQEDLVVVILGMKLYGHEELACIWNQLMPGLKAEPIKPEKKLQTKLDKLCARAILQLPKGKKKSAHAGPILKIGSNRHGFLYLSIPGNELVRIDNVSGKKDMFDLGYGEWRYTPMNGYPVYSINAINMMRDLKDDFVAAAAYAWTSSSTLEVRIHYVNWISGTTLVFDFDKHELTMRDTYPNSKPETVHFVVAR